MKYCFILSLNEFPCFKHKNLRVTDGAWKRFDRNGEKCVNMIAEQLLRWQIPRSMKI